MTGRIPLLAAVLCVLCVLAGPAVGWADAPRNLFTNGGFEMGQAGWGLQKGAKTVASYKVDGGDAGQGRHSAVVTIGKVEEWGVQFGQTFEAGRRGKTYTFAAIVKAVGGPVTVSLQIERNAKPWDRAARSRDVRVPPGEWTELHVTFPVEKDFAPGWFAYVSCTQADCTFRVDGVRLHEGEFVPLAETVREQAAAVSVRLYDVGKPSAGPVSAASVARRPGWAQLAEEDANHAFAGGAALANNRLAVVLRIGAAGAEVYSLGPAGAKLRARLVPEMPASWHGHLARASQGRPGPARGTAVGRIADLKVVKNAQDESSVEATFQAGGKAMAMTFALTMGQPIVATQSRSGAAALRLEAPARFAVLPDFFADDLVLDARELPVAAAELPADHFLLHMLPDRDAIVLAVRNPAAGDVGLTLSGEGEARRIAASRIPYGKEGKIWAAVLARERIWHAHTVSRKDVGRVIPVGWSAPVPALWRLDWRKDDGLTDSWEMVAQRPGGSFAKYGWFGPAGTVPANRKRWATVLGSFLYPCWLDESGRGFIQPLKRGVRFDGPALIYPINRVRDTPHDEFTVVDVVRNTLGVGPCEYVLDVEGTKARYRGIATCGARSVLNPIYQKGRQKRERAKIEKTLVDVVVFIRFIRSRIEEYVAYGSAMRQYLAERKKAQPELAKHIDALDAACRIIDGHVARRRAKIKTPADAQKLADEFRRTMLTYEGPDAYKKCRVFTEAWVAIGGNQDELVGECRMAVKALRQRAALAAAVEPGMIPIAREIRTRSRKVLRNPASHEGATH